MPPDSTAIPKFTGERIFTVLFFVVLCAYIITAVGFAVYLAWRAYTVGIGDFEKAALGSIIAVIGTGLTACAALYTAHRQALVGKRDSRRAAPTETRNPIFC